jgi:hypothetical protein
MPFINRVVLLRKALKHVSFIFCRNARFYRLTYVAVFPFAAILIDVLKNVQFLSKRRDELIIRQGDEADWYAGSCLIPVELIRFNLIPPLEGIFFSQFSGE